MPVLTSARSVTVIVNVKAAPSDIWTQISSIATFSAVIVALIPIFIQWGRTRSAILNLRARILSYLTVLSIALLKMADTHRPPESRQTQFLDAERNAADALDKTLAEVSILSSKEQILIMAVHTNLMSLQSLSQGKESHLVPKIAHELLPLVTSLQKTIEKKKWFKGKFPVLPWDHAKKV